MNPALGGTEPKEAAYAVTDFNPNQNSLDQNDTGSTFANNTPNPITEFIAPKREIIKHGLHGF